MPREPAGAGRQSATPRPTIADARDLLSRARAHLRPAVLVELHSVLPAHLWLRVVGEFWCRIEGDRGRLTELMRMDRGWRGLMTAPAESVMWSHLPATFTAWRGCYRGLNETGVAYSLREADARKFPFMGRFREDREEPVLIEATIERDACAVKVDSGVAEVLAARTVQQKVNPLRWQPPVELFNMMSPTVPVKCGPALCLHMPSLRR
jgi:hypothetical protein